MITNYSELQDAISAAMRRSDMGARIPSFIQLAEERINKELRVPILQTTSSLDVTADTQTVSLPDNCLEVAMVHLSGGGRIRRITQADGDLRYSETDKGTPAEYYIYGNLIYLCPIPAQDGTIVVSYYRKVSALSDGNTTNDILSEYPGIYLHGALVEAYRHVRNAERMGESEIAYQQALVLANRQLIKQQSGDYVAPRRKNVP